MTDTSAPIAYVRLDDAPRLSPPPGTVGWQGWVMQNLFSSPLNSLASILFGSLLLWLIQHTFYWGVINATWHGDTREACNWEGAGACWPLIRVKMQQWIYGFYPFDQRWRVNTCFFVGAAALTPMLMPSVGYKLWNVLFLLIVFPLMTLILLTGGNFGFTWVSYATIITLMFLSAAFLPLTILGVEDGIAANKPALILAAIAVVLWVASFEIAPVLVSGVSLIRAAIAVLLAVAAGLSIQSIIAKGGQPGMQTVKGWLVVLAGIIAAMLLLGFDFGLMPIETTQWGGLTITLVVSITGIVASLPIGIVLALGRRSKMPVVRGFSVAFIELWRGVPLITVLFMSSVMLPLFLPPGTNFDKLLRALIGVGLFSAAYMAEVVRSGLQAIPRGQNEGAMALGLSYWQTMGKIILPQALKISIPNIVGNFISLFKDTTLVAIIGLFDLWGIVKSGLSDGDWATASAAPTSFFTVAIMFWVFCFGMSRYSQFVERRLNTGHKR
jgi:general L-amino acid transport system permease protein